MATKKAAKKSAKKSTTKKAVKKAAKKTTAKKSTVKKSVKKAAKKSAKKSSSRRYSPSAGKNVETEIKAMKAGKLKSGRSNKRVTNPKQAIAIGLSKARKEGKKVPSKKS